MLCALRFRLKRAKGQLLQLAGRVCTRTSAGVPGECDGLRDRIRNLQKRTGMFERKRKLDSLRNACFKRHKASRPVSTIGPVVEGVDRGIRPCARSCRHPYLQMQPMQPGICRQRPRARDDTDSAQTFFPSAGNRLLLARARKAWARDSVCLRRPVYVGHRSAHRFSLRVPRHALPGAATAPAPRLISRALSNHSRG